MKTRKRSQFGFTSSFGNTRMSMVWAVLCLAVCMSGLGVSANAQHPKIITLDVPGAGTGAGQGTFPFNIFQGEWISGIYIDADNVYHGFLRSPGGAITKFDVPGGGTGPGQGTVEVKGMTPAPEIVGTILDANNVWHGFLRTRSGRFTIFDAPDAGKGAFQGTGGLSVNPSGLILGIYLDANDLWHGFLRSPDGAMTEFGAPGAGTVPGSYQGTYPANLSGINPEGANVGEYCDTNYLNHGYLLAPDGTFTEFDDPNARTGADTGQGTLALGINPAGEISGCTSTRTMSFMATCVRETAP